MFHHALLLEIDPPTFLCLRRGVSDGILICRVARSFSLPTQRCFWRRDPDEEGICLFSAYAEVFPAIRAVCWQVLPFLCLRRGVSSSGSVQSQFLVFSLPTQRCFFLMYLSALVSPLFSAYAEVFPPAAECSEQRRPFLCLRRGVSKGVCSLTTSSPFSLPTQRCFCCWSYSWRHQPTFLCLRRGVSRPG